MTSPERPDPTAEPTGVIDLNATQRIPTEHAPSAAEQPVAGQASEAGVPQRADAPEPVRATPAGQGGQPTAHLDQPALAAPAAAGEPSSAASSTPQPTPSATLPPPSGPSFPMYPPQRGDSPRSSAPQGVRRRSAIGVTALCLASGLLGGVGGALVVDRAGTTTSSSTTRPTVGATGTGPTTAAVARPDGSVAKIAAQVMPSVVTVKVSGASVGSEGTGSGFVFDGDGHILTNNHVIESVIDGGDIEVLFADGESAKATIVGHDQSYDVAVLKMDRGNVPAITFGESKDVVVGDEVIAVGAPLGLDATVTTGIVSALDRPVTPGSGNESSFINAIQTDAAINPGNSGGPLINMSGEVIGINSAIARVPGSSSSSGGNIGLGFAIPSDVARRTAEEIIKTGKATHPIIGVSLDRTFDGVGAKVSSASDGVTSGGPADKAGVKPGDVIVAFEGKTIRTPDQLVVSIRARAVGDTVTITVERDGAKQDLSMTLQAAPAQ